MKKWLISRSHDPNKELMTNHMAVVNKNILPLRILKKTMLYRFNSDKLSALISKFLCYKDRLIKFS